MSTRTYAVVLALLLAATAQAENLIFPKGPPRMKDAEAQGLQRVRAEELKALFPGTSKSVAAAGRGFRTFKPDGVFEIKTFQDLKGTWRIDEKNNAYCMAARVAGKYGDECFAVFRAPDGTHYFDYDIEDGAYSRTWRPATGPYE